MAMKLVRKSAEYKIFLRGDNRYAVQNVNGKPVNGEEKVNILIAEELIKVAAPAGAAPDVEEVVEVAAEEVAEEVVAEEEVSAGEAAQEAASAAKEVPAEDAAGEEAPAEEPPVEEAPLGEPADDEEAK